MKYLVDGGRLVWVLARSPADAADLTRLTGACSPVLTVYELPAGYKFEFCFGQENNSDGVNHATKENTSRV